MTQSPESPLPAPKERRRLREVGSLTQAQVAERLGVSPKILRGWESGRISPGGPHREAYARLLSSLALAASAADGAIGTRRAPKETALESTAPQPLLAPPAVEDAVPSTVTPAQAFDALYAFCVPALVRQTYLLTGRCELARESVERAFQLAWQHWPEVARDRDPAGWVRAAAYDCALSPWHRFRPRNRHPEPPPADTADRVLLDTLRRLPPPYRRTLVLYDGVGLGLPETAAETEASTPAAASRLTHARQAVAASLPELADPSALHRRLAELASTERLRPAGPEPVRTEGERKIRFWTQAAIAFTVTIIGATTFTLRTAPTYYEPPIAPAQAVRGLPPQAALGPLSSAEQMLRAKLAQETGRGPERVLPLGR
ncbi:helix-turn-helix domain-containing protein [Streptomyces brasiliensis]|uniref:HTH cro/C1-type domain-containing protein n=1 Tax=Streptomyces brasiliensis TaxID=1954 RepID=A0A917KNI1_9ACTN|nr:helix-turn-helix domain-containing protein [Streptomyces brasiliensis]GGJ20293.1 hypothetical protein GCM10010121_034020 [Streptomyces brasiliensis]